jgi:hypothetical protein
VREPDSSPHNVIYIVAVALSTLHMFYALYWALVEVLGRAGLWPAQFAWFDVAGFVATESLLNATLFALNFVLTSSAYILLIKKNKSVILIYLAAIIVELIDWALLATNPYYNNLVGGALGITFRIMVVAMLWRLHSTKQLR